MDNSTHVADLKRLVKDFCDERDWSQFHDPKNLAEAISIESAELLEHMLWRSSAEAKEKFATDAAYREKVADEVSDVFGYVLQLSVTLDLDLSSALKRKYEKNAQKYPVETFRGTTTKYTDI